MLVRIAFLLLLATAISGGLPAGLPNAEERAMKLHSPAFSQGARIPARHTCEGGDVSPPLVWTNVPETARSLALVVEDPDAPDPKAPRMIWTHWVVHDIPTGAPGLPEGASGRMMPKGAVEGYNDWKRIGYGGPCPPIGEHRYFFRLYALDTVLSPRPMTRSALLEAMRGHVLAEAVLVGLYEKER